MKVSVKNVVALVFGFSILVSTAFAQTEFVVEAITPNQADADSETDPLSTLMITGTARATTAAEIGNDPALDGAQVFDLSISNPDAFDILSFSVELDIITGSLYNNQFGTDNNPHNTALEPSFPAITADSWVTTPDAGTALAGDALGSVSAEGAPGRTRVFDTASMPMTEFHWGRITLLPGSDPEATVAGVVQISDAAGDLHRNAFKVRLGAAVPEPTSLGLALVSCLGCLGLIRRKR